MASEKKQKFKVRGSRHNFVPKIRKDDLQPNALVMSGGNRYHEGNNPKLGEYISHVQGAINGSVDAKSNMKTKTQSLFDKMKETRERYLSNLFEGEKSGICKGLKDRLQNKYKKSYEFMVLDPKKVAKELREK